MTQTQQCAQYFIKDIVIVFLVDRRQNVLTYLVHFLMNPRLSSASLKLNSHVIHWQIADSPFKYLSMRKEKNWVVMLNEYCMKAQV
jgi:hypothetical protein